MAPTVDRTRATIHRIFSKEHSLILKGDGLRWIQDMLAHYKVAPADLDETLLVLAKGCETEAVAQDASLVVDQHILQRVYEKLQASSKTADDDEDPYQPKQTDEESVAAEVHSLQVVDAFNVPRLVWSEERKMFEKPMNRESSSKPSMLGKPSSRSTYLRDRYQAIRQVILRNEHFSPPAVAGAIEEGEREEYMKLTSTNNLLGRVNQRFLLFGMLSRMKDQSFCLEDLDGRVKLDLSIASAAEGLFTEGCFVLAEGEYKPDQTFQVLEIGHPPSEQRITTRKLFGNIDFWGSGLMSLNEEKRLKSREDYSSSQFLVLSLYTWIIIQIGVKPDIKSVSHSDLSNLSGWESTAIAHRMSDFHLDQPKVLMNLEKIMKKYEDQLIESDGSILPPPLWIICGNFCSSPFLCDSKMLAIYKNLFEKMANSLSKFARLLHHIHLILVPGPQDPWDSTCLPRPCLPASIIKPLKSTSSNIPAGNLHLGSNPCRIKWLSQEIVVFREDLASKFCRNLILDVIKDPSLSSNSQPMDLTKYLVQTILDQAHLSPFAINIRPVIWEFDQALRLYPMPTALILADSYPAYELTYEGCHVFNPGSFGVGSRPTWSNYSVCKQTSEQRQVLSIFTSILTICFLTLNR